MKSLIVALSATFAFAATASGAELAYRGPDSEAMTSTGATAPASVSNSKASDAKPLDESDETKARSSDTIKSEKVPAKSEKAPAESEAVTEPANSEPDAKARPRPKSGRKVGVSPDAYREAKWHSGKGATWRTRSNAYGFSGAYGGCSYRGVASPDGFRIDRIC